MSNLRQTPAPGAHLRGHAGDIFTITLELPDMEGSAFLRTNLCHAAVRREEIIESADAGRPYLARDWHDIPMEKIAPGRFSTSVPLSEVGIFAAKTCFIPGNGKTPLWPDGGDIFIKVAPASSCAANMVYTAFPRQFGPNISLSKTPATPEGSSAFEEDGYSLIPPSGTFRDLKGKLDFIFGELGFRILQLLPVHPVPTTFARMGSFGSPFASSDFMSVDPALAEFDPSATQMDQFRELLFDVHSRGGRLFLDLPANHTGWSSVLLNHHPEWFKREHGGVFRSPGAWGVVWRDLVELDYSKAGIRSFMAEVFEFWCREGVDGFRCDAGYMIPVDIWEYIVARVRSQYPDTVFLLEGLGGKISVTTELLNHANLDWAYSELFQTEDRTAFEHYLPNAMSLSSESGPLIHFAETHDNLRLAAKSPEYSSMRCALAALISQDGAFGITNGVEWFATERVDVHGASALNWGAERNQCAWLRRINTLLAVNPAFVAGAEIRFIQREGGNSLAAVRIPACAGISKTAVYSPATEPGSPVLVLVNLDTTSAQSVAWPISEFDPSGVVDLLGQSVPKIKVYEGICRAELAPASALCLGTVKDADTVEAALSACVRRTPARVIRQEALASALGIRAVMCSDRPALASGEDPAKLASAFLADPAAYIESFVEPGALPPVSVWRWPQDSHRVAPVPPGNFILIEAARPFKAHMRTCDCPTVIQRVDSIELSSTRHIAVFSPLPTEALPRQCKMLFRFFGDDGVVCAEAGFLSLARGRKLNVPVSLSGMEARSRNALAMLSNGCGAMSHVQARWPEIRSRYDALLAANPDPCVPCDRQILWTRCRMWLRNRGYSQSIDASCLEKFVCPPGGRTALWKFKVPVGLGQWTPVTIKLSMEFGENRAVLSVMRGLAPNGGTEAYSDDENVTIIMRPDIESRSFHEITKAFTGPENNWPGACATESDGLLFRPDGRPGLSLKCSEATYTSEPEWNYMVGLPFDAERGMDGATDLFSPGYFSLDLGGGESADVLAEMIPSQEHDPVALSNGRINDLEDEMDLSAVLLKSLCDYIVRRDDLSTVIAGYPWFLDWGRDTFIVLRGMIAAGMTDSALAILREFGRFERGGTLPNMIRGNDDSNRDTSDAPLWFAVAAHDLSIVLGRSVVLDADCGGRSLSAVLESLATGYRDGTVNGIKMDPESGLIFSPAHYTWMDTNFPAGTPREGYPIEIQALWISTLRFLSSVRPEGGWDKIADKAAESLPRLFWRDKEEFLSDCLHCKPGTGAADAVADDHLRCNQLFAITLGALTDIRMCRSVLRSCETLLVPGAIRTLADKTVSYELPVWNNGRLLNNPREPYWGRYCGDEDTRRKPAYHNGTAWSWPFPSYAEALVKVYGASASQAARSMLGSCRGMLLDGAIGHLPEIVDGDVPHTQRGCDAQAWSVSEFLRCLILLDSMSKKRRMSGRSHDKRHAL